MVDDASLVGAMESPGLNPGVGEVLLTVTTEQQDAPYGRDDTALMLGDESQRLQIGVAELPDVCERLGSGSEVHCFRAQFRPGLFVVCRTARGTPPVRDVAPGREAQRRDDITIDGLDPCLPLLGAT
ncbi:MAG: hypothetical protein ACQSGP_02100 [Frankia sp.]